MAHTTNSKLKIVAAAILFAICGLGNAQVSNAKNTEVSSSNSTVESNDKRMDEYINLGRSVTKSLLDSYNNRAPSVERDLNRSLQKSKQRVDDIANESIAQDRDRVMRFLGIDPQAETALFFFVSWSMPIEMLRSYAIEAMWSGGSMIFKGVPPDRDLGTFILKDLQGLVYGKGASANISIDPRLFDAYDIKLVPSIVFTKVRGDMTCRGLVKTEFEFKNSRLAYDKCPALDEDLYYKISGAVTTYYALEKFKSEGENLVVPYINALSKGFKDGKAPDKEQKPFIGKWESVFTPNSAINNENQYVEPKKISAQ